MPPLYVVDDYDQCIKEFETEAKYCVANIVIEKDKTSDLWNQIEVRNELISYQNGKVFMTLI